jgi:hypothetical protein
MRIKPRPWIRSVLKGAGIGLLLTLLPPVGFGAVIGEVEADAPAEAEAPDA